MTTKNQFENVQLIYLLDRHSFLQHFIDCTYTDAFSKHTVCISFFSLRTRDSDWAVTAQKRTDKEYFYSQFFLFLHYNHEIKITENKVDWSICLGQTRENTHVLDTTASWTKWRPRRIKRILVRILPAAVPACPYRRTPDVNRKSKLRLRRVLLSLRLKCLAVNAKMRAL